MTDIIKTLKEMKEIDNCIKEIPCPDMETEPHRITLKRVKSIIFIKKHNDETKLRFNLKTKRMEKYYKRDKCWKYVQHQYGFFQGFRISDIITDEEKFKRIIELIKKTNGACSSLSTFIGRMGNALVYENYWDEKIQAIEPWNRHQLLTKPLNFYPKQAINLFKSLNIEITKRIEDNFIENKEIIIKILDIIPNIEITDSENQNSNAGNTGVFGGAVVVGGMSQQGGINTGDNFGKLGTAVKNSPGEISGYTKHGLNQKITRSVSSEAVQNAVKNPQVVLRQAGGNKLYLTSKAAVVLNKAKQVVTTYGANFFKAPIKNIIKLIK